jgi:N-methylhydantoinase A
MSRKRQNVASTVRVGVDTGGTFTDFVFQSKGHRQILKLPSTPHDPSRAISAGLRQVAVTAGVSLAGLEVTHGTTVGTNALLQRRGARLVLVTTRGFEDVLAIGRQARPELYNLNVVREPPLVPDGQRLGIKERVAASGDVLVPLDDTELELLLQKIKALKPDAIAVSLLFAFAYPEHEQRIARALKQLKIPLSISHLILPEYREYERTSTVVINAYLQPLMGVYLRRLTARVPRLRVMQSSGGIISATAAADEPVRTILSGPAGGVVGAMNVATVAKQRNIITFDMGGTSTDVALIDRDGIRTTSEAIVADMPVAVAVMDIHTVGAGGGSIARVDEGGSLRVGPESAGADPGPACYGKSLLPTVTDAHAVLGHFADQGLLGGEFKLDTERARSALQTLADAMSAAAKKKIAVAAAAEGVLTVVNTNMERALRRISVERGFDPRDFVLVPFGGAGGLHAVDLARALQITRVLMPKAPGALSALGVLTADVVKDQSRTVMLAAAPGSQRQLQRVFREMERLARLTLGNEGFSQKHQRHERSVAARYRGQSFELELKTVTSDIARQFHRAHRARYGYAEESNEVEIVSARLRSSGSVERIKSRLAMRSKTKVKADGYVAAYFGGRRVKAAVYERERLMAGVRFVGPAIVTEYSATTLVPAESMASVDAYGNLVIEA